MKTYVYPDTSVLAVQFIASLCAESGGGPDLAPTPNPEGDPSGGSLID